MTEKRFKSINCGLQGQYIKDNGTVLTIDDVVDLLNELNDENKELKQTIKRLNSNIDELLDISVAEDLLKENKELKSELNECRNNKLFSRRELEKENQHLKDTIKQAYNNERTQLGRNVLKQLLEAIQ